MDGVGEFRNYQITNITEVLIELSIPCGSNFNKKPTELASDTYHAFRGTNKAANADEASPPDPADYREPKQMTKMEEPPSPMELLLQKTKFRLAENGLCL